MMSKLGGNSPILALIPARGGSKSIHRKNLRVVGGKSMLLWSVEAAQGAAHIDGIYLSSEDDEILALGTVSNVRTIRRPEEFAKDASTAADVVRHFISTLDHDLQSKDPFIVYLQPTSPLRNCHHIDDAIEAMFDARCVSLLSVVKTEKSPFKTFILSEDGKLKSLFDEKYSNFNRQELPVTFIPNGAIYIFKMTDFLRRDGFPSDGSHPYIMSASASADVDNEVDLLEVERRLRTQND